jgi:hypothetical protein
MNLRAERLERVREHRGRHDSIRVEIAEHRNRLALVNRAPHPFHRRAHARDFKRIRQRRNRARGETPERLARKNAARSQNPRQRLWQVHPTCHKFSGNTNFLPFVLRFKFHAVCRVFQNFMLRNPNGILLMRVIPDFTRFSCHKMNQARLGVFQQATKCRCCPRHGWTRTRTTHESPTQDS